MFPKIQGAYAHDLTKTLKNCKIPTRDAATEPDKAPTSDEFTITGMTTEGTPLLPDPEA